MFFVGVITEIVSTDLQQKLITHVFPESLDGYDAAYFLYPEFISILA